jgi:hypothetical protein
MIFSYRNPDNFNEKYSDSALSIKDIGIAGGIVGLSVALIHGPIEYAKIKKQINSDLSHGSLSILFD